LAGFTAAICSPWWACPVAADLHPVYWNAWARFHTRTVAAMSAPPGAAAFGPVVAEADAHWRLMRADDHGVPMDAEKADQWLDVALVGAILGANGVLDETMDRAPQLSVLRLTLDTFLNPSVDVEGTSSGVRVAHRSGGRERQRLVQAEADAGFTGAPTRRPSFSVGLSWNLKTADAAPEDPLFSPGAYLSLLRVAGYDLRATYGAFDGDWAVNGRQKLAPHVFALGAIRTADRPVVPQLVLDRFGPPDPAQPGAWLVGAMWETPWSPWQLRLERVAAWAGENVVWRVVGRAEWGTLPPGRRSVHLAPLPETRPWRPNDLVSPIESPADPPLPPQDPPETTAPRSRRRGGLLDPSPEMAGGG
jgi:hypothetical protein